MPFNGKHPQIHPSVFVAPSADVIGDVEIGENSSLWFQTVLRGDIHWIKIGKNTNIQDQSCLHVTRNSAPLSVGDDVTIGHRVTLHGCTIKDRVLVGMGSTVLDGAVVPENSVIGAGSLVTQGKTFESGYLILGSPAKAVRRLTHEELAYLEKSARNYVRDASDYLSYFRGEKQEHTK